jgi:3-oxoacyl-[acyl-carrier protein] reductase
MIAARDRFGRLDGALISVGGSPGGTIADTPDESWQSAAEGFRAMDQRRAIKAILSPCGATRALSCEFSGDGRIRTGGLVLPSTIKARPQPSHCQRLPEEAERR